MRVSALALLEQFTCSGGGLSQPVGGESNRRGTARAGNPDYLPTDGRPALGDSLGYLAVKGATEDVGSSTVYSTRGLLSPRGERSNPLPTVIGTGECWFISVRSSDLRESCPPDHPELLKPQAPRFTLINTIFFNFGVNCRNTQRFPSACWKRP